MKRSSQVALVLMGAAGMGAGAYAMMPRSDCVAPGMPPAINAPSTSIHSAVQPCPPRSSSGSRYFWHSYWSRPLFSRTSNTPAGAVPLAGGNSSPSAPRSSTISSQRGGFGSTGLAMSSGS